MAEKRKQSISQILDYPICLDEKNPINLLIQIRKLVKYEIKCVYIKLCFKLIQFLSPEQKAFTNNKELIIILFQSLMSRN